MGLGYSWEAPSNRRPHAIRRSRPGNAETSRTWMIPIQGRSPLKDFIERSLRRVAEASNRAALQAEKLQEFSHVTTRDSLLQLVGKKLKDRKLLLVSNREPYAHVRQGDNIAVIRNAGGLTTALDSVAKAFRALWVCHGGTVADFEVVDSNGMVSVPPGEESYRLKRLRLTRREEEGY